MALAEREKGQPIEEVDSLQTNDKMKPFEEEHPHFQAQKPLWDRYDAVLGGMETDSQKKKWLPQFPFELEDLYEARIKSSEFLGGSEVAVDRLVGACFAAEPQIASESEKVQSWMEDVDGEGSSLRDIMEEASGKANGYGIAFAHVYKRGPRIELEEGAELSKAQEEAAGPSTAIVELLDAEEVPSWGMLNGGVVWVGIRQVIREAPDPMKPAKKMERWRVIDKMKTVPFERELKEDAAGQKPALTEGATTTHNLGRLPVIPIYGARKKRFQGESYIKAASRADLAKFREDSWGQQARNIHANPILSLKSDRKLKEIWIGGNAVRLKKDEEMAYIPLETGAMDKRDQASERYTREGVRVTGSNPSFTTDGLTFQGESGVAQRQRFSQTEQRYIKRHTKGLESSTLGVMDLGYLILEGATEVPDGTNRAQFFNTFEVLELQSLVTAYNGVALSIESDTFHKEVQTNLALRLVGDAPQDVRAKIKAEIEASTPLGDGDGDGDDEGGGDPSGTTGA